MQTEKRKSRRIKTHFNFDFRVPDSSNTSIFTNTKTKDISGTGMQFHSPIPLSIGSTIEIKLNLPDIIEPLNMIGKVVYISQGEEERYLIGVTFTHLEPEALETLKRQVESIDIYPLLEEMVKQEASDLHLTANHIPILRIDRELRNLGNKNLTSDEVNRLVYSIMSPQQTNTFEKLKELNFAHSIPELGRWRINVHLQQGYVESAFRLIKPPNKTIDELGLPRVVEDLAKLSDGLVVVSGPAGVGKSTTIAAMIELINREFKKVIITLEDPIEFVHQSKKSLIKQREVGTDTHSFKHGLKHVLRQDPNVIFIGEVRDLETMITALTAAETGHLVLTTLHTNNAPQTVNRILGIFPHDQRQGAALQLSSCLRGVICKQLLPGRDNQGLVVTTEVLIGTPAVKGTIRQMKIEQLHSLIQTGAQDQMHSMDNSLLHLYERKLISYETASNWIRDSAILAALMEKRRNEQLTMQKIVSKSR
ncbi:MAG: PilT/PilU family type 4a pilus ATPase [candidate division Zixibacteria bacterium]|nr:PilT/PilU family type 4a pilus ATPase [candidate division Zixibacteria bacterium]